MGLRPASGKIVHSRLRENGGSLEKYPLAHELYFCRQWTLVFDKVKLLRQEGEVVGL